jgi:hypothetical protein
MKVDLREIVNAQRVLARLFSAPVKKGKTVMRLVRFKREVKAILEDWNDARRGLLEQYAVPVRDGEVVEPEAADEFGFWLLEDGEVVRDEDGEPVEDEEARCAFEAEYEELMALEESVERYLREYDLEQINDALDRPLSADEIDATAWAWEDLRGFYEGG